MVIYEIWSIDRDSTSKSAYICSEIVCSNENRLAILADVNRRVPFKLGQICTGLLSEGIEVTAEESTRLVLLCTASHRYLACE